MKKQNCIFDIEVIGKEKPVFLVCVENTTTNERHVFWAHKRGHAAKLEALLNTKGLNFVSFNGERFDGPLLAAYIAGHDADNLKIIAQEIIENELMPWEALAFAKVQPLDFNHIDLINVAPGVMTSLKIYMGRMHYPSLIDMPFHHDTDLTPKQLPVVENYCMNDLGGTRALMNMLKEELQLREEMSEQYGLDLRSKSDAQIAEAILKKACGISGRQRMPSGVTYKAPNFIQPKSGVLKDLLFDTEQETFKINYMNGSPIEAEWMEQPIQINNGVYKYGLGGLHSQHDICFHDCATDEYLISDFDVASYYPSIMLACDYAPRLGLNKGELFLEAYREIYKARIAAKKAGNKKLADSLKIVLNGTFGKLGSSYCSFYSPDLLIAVTLTGQLNLLCLIDDLERTKGVRVLSANTDGIMVGYPKSKREAVLKTIAANAKRTEFVYEETPYAKVAMKDVNNYIAITTNGKVKAKGLYADSGLMKNPTMEVCSLAARQYLIDGTLPEKFITKHLRSFKNFKDFLAIRSMKKPGGVQHPRTVIVDDWQLLNDFGTKDNIWYSPTSDKKEKRKSRPHAYTVGVGGEPFGRVARWYMTTQVLPPITYVESGNKVPKTDGAKLCMILPTAIPADLNRQWYIDETYNILADIGVLKNEQ